MLLYLNQGWKETEPWIDKAHGEIGHSGEFHRAVDVSVDLSGDCASGLVNDCVHLGRENENRETLQAEFEFSHLLYDIKVSLIVGELHPSHAKLFVQGHFVCGVYFSE